MKWTEKYKLGAAETDVNSIASPSAILRYMQDSSNSQMLALKPTYEELIDRGLSFVLSKITVSMYGTLKAHENF